MKAVHLSVSSPSQGKHPMRSWKTTSRGQREENIAPQAMMNLGTSKIANGVWLYK